jgi:uncharacterized protein DUF5343
MAVTQDQPAPYATAGSITSLIERYRERGLTTPITADVLARAGVSDSLIPRTLQALEALDLIDEEGRPTPTFEGLRLATQGDYQQRLREWLNGAYADVLKFIDPATADETAVRDAFRTYNPVGQQPRMVSLFTGLYSAAGVGPEKNAQPRPKSIPTSPRRRIPAGWERTVGLKTPPAKTPFSVKHTSTGLPEPLAGLLSRLPQEGDGWTQFRRDKFMTTFGTVLDFCFPIVEEGANDEQDTEP